MQKKIIVILSAIIIIVSIIVMASNIENKTYIEVDGNKYYAVVDGKPTSTFPTGNYTVDVDCTNAKGYWDSVNKKVIVKNITGSVSCDVAFTKISESDYLADYIINLQSTSPTQGASAADGTLVKDDGGENDIRYEGKNPYNYVLFNNELWRIIGVFDESSHGVSNTNLVKLIRADSIGGLAWNKSNTNDWVNSSLKALLNGAYYNATTDTTNCYGYSTTITSTCDYTVKGIQSGYRGMIQNVTWYLGGGGATGYTTYTPASIYEYERNSSAIYSGNSASTTGYIGLMYTSDYFYGVLSSSCGRTTVNSSYNTAKCAGSDWLNVQGEERTISQNSSNSNYVWYVTNNGNGGGIASNAAYVGFAVRPVLYLKSDVYRISGTGTISDPYIIGEYYDPNAPKYWNDDFSKTKYAIGSTPATTYTSLTDISNLSNYPYYIKTTSTEHQTCLYWSDTGKEFCLSANYWVDDDSDGSVNEAKLLNDMASALEVDTSSLSCGSDWFGAYCYVGSSDLSCVSKKAELVCGDTYRWCTITSDGNAYCYS